MKLLWADWIDLVDLDITNIFPFTFTQEWSDVCVCVVHACILIFYLFLWVGLGLLGKGRNGQYGHFKVPKSTQTKKSKIFSRILFWFRFAVFSNNICGLDTALHCSKRS